MNVAALLALLLVLSSCTSLSNLVRSQVEGVPSWVYTPVVSANKTAFVGKGSTQVLFNAKLMAYEDILNQISTFIGEPVQSTYYRELTTTDGIAEFALSIVNEHSKTEPRAPSQFYLLATADTAKLVSRRTSVYNAVLQRDKDIAALIGKADKAYRANNDIEAIALYFQATILSSEGSVSSKKFEVDALLSKSITFINALRFSLSKSDPSQARTTVQLRRKSRLLSPKVLNAPIVATFEAQNSLGNHYSDSLSFNTASDGFIEFVPYNYGLAGSGSIRFGVDFSSSLGALQQAVPQEKLEPLFAAMEKQGILFPYSLVSSLANKTIVADIQEYEYNGTQRPGKQALGSLLDLYGSRGLSITATSLVGEEQQELFDEVQKKAPSANMVVKGKAGVAEETVVGDQHVVVVTGSVQVWDLKKKTMVGNTLEVEAVAFAALSEDAKQEAFRRFGMISSSLLLATFF